MAERLLAGLKRLNRWIAVAVGIGLVLAAGFVLLDIALRQVGSSLGGTDEISGYVMAIATAWGMGFALMELAHVRIDLLRVRAGARLRAVFDLGAMFVLSLVVSLIGWHSWPVVSRTIDNGSRANTPLETPLVLVQMPWFLGWVWFALVSWLTLVACLVLVLRGRFDTSETYIGAFNEVDANT